MTDSASPVPADQQVDPYAEHRRVNHDDIEGKIFVGGLSWQTTEASLRFHFEKFGELSDAAIMTDRRTGQPRGFGFITMKDPSAADIIVTTEHTIDGRVVDVKRAVPRDMAPAPSRLEAKKIFVGGLPSEATEKEFAEYFSKFGQVKDAVVMVDRATNRSRGFGFITFEHEDSIEAVLRNKNEIFGKWVEVKRAEPRDLRDGPRGMGMNQGGYGGGGMGYNGRGGGDQRGGRGGYGYGNRNMMMQGGGYGAQYVQDRAPMGYGGMRYPAGYGGAGNRAYGQPTGQIGQGYGYPNGQMQQGMGYYGGQPGYGYGQGQGAYGNAQAYGGAQRDGVDGGPDSPNGAQNGANGYGGMQQYGAYGGQTAGYGGGAYGAYNVPQGTDDAQKEQEAAGFGGIRGQGATQGRIDRSYRPY